MWVLESEPGSSERSVNIINCCATPVVTIIYCYLDWICSQPRDVPLGWPERVFPGRINQGEKLLPERGLNLPLEAQILRDLRKTSEACCLYLFHIAKSFFSIVVAP